jgi:predicted MPP superfamily phosphohydrolase
MLAFYAYAIEPWWLRVRHRVLYLDGWAPALDGVRVLHFPDLHIGHSTNRVVGFLERAAREDVDLVVITGDFIAGPQGIAEIKAVLRKLTERHRVVGILGNDEHRYRQYKLPTDGRWRGWAVLDVPEILRELTEAGVTMLVNAKHEVDVRVTTVTLAGVDDPLSDTDDLAAAFGGLCDMSTVVTLSHSPGSHAEAAALGIPLLLVGHTHGGQIRLGPLFRPVTGNRTPLECPSGIIKRGATTPSPRPARSHPSGSS